jgi:hypothetical protein
MPLVNMRFFIAALSYASWSIRNVSEGDLCSKTQHFMLACCSVARQHQIIRTDNP